MPTSSTAATVRVCWPSVSPAKVEGDGQAEKLLAPSSWQTKVTGVLFEPKVKMAVLALVTSAGCVTICVDGGTVSTVQV